MPRVVWADTPNGPDSSSTPTGGAAPPDDDPFQLHLDEARVRQADNDAVDQWKSLSGPWFASRGGDAATRWKDIEQSLNEIVHRPLGELDTVRQRAMYRDIMAPRLEAWGDEARAHATREAQAYNDAESQQRQDLALAAMRRGARLGDMRAVAEGERRLIGEVRERSRRQGLDPDAASAAEAEALGAAHSDVALHLAQHDPQRAQDWLNAQAGMIGDPAKVDRLSRMLQPYVAEQQQEGLVDLIRGEASDLPAQHAAVDAMGLDPNVAGALKQRLADKAEGDRRTAKKEQDAAFARVMAVVRDPATQSLRSLSASDYDILTPERQDAVRAVMAANLRGDGHQTALMPTEQNQPWADEHFGDSNLIAPLDANNQEQADDETGFGSTALDNFYSNPLNKNANEPSNIIFDVNDNVGANFILAGRASGTNFPMRNEIIRYVKNNRSSIISTASILDVPRTAIAAAIAEEYRTFGYAKDWAPDRWGWGYLNLSLDPNAYLERMYKLDEEAIKGGTVQNSDESWGKAGKIRDPLKLDIGSGNFNFGTAMYLVKEYMKDHPGKADDPLNLKSYSGNFQNLYRDMMNDKTDIIVKLTGLRLKEVKDLYENIKSNNDSFNRKVRDSYEKGTAMQRDMLLDFGYRNSLKRVKKRIMERLKNKDTHYNMPLRDNSMNFFLHPLSPYHQFEEILKDDSI